MAVALDAVTGLPLDGSYLTQYQIPLGSQPINLEELGALGRQSNWLYPDNLPGVVSRLQARDNTNPLNAQDLSTDGKRNLNVNINASNVPSGGGIAPIALKTDGPSYGVVAIGASVATSLPGATTAVYAIQCTWDVNNVDTPGLSGNILFGIQGSSSGNLIFLYQGSLSLIDAGTTNDVRESIYLPLNPPISIPLMNWLDGGGDVQAYILNNTVETIDAAMLVYYS